MWAVDVKVLKGGLDQGERLVGGRVRCAISCIDLCQHYVVKAED